MKTQLIQPLDPAACLHCMESFWREQVEAVRTRDGVALTLPLMYPDGWQVTVHITPTAPGWARLSDHGKTLGMLVERGMRLEAGHTASLLDQRLQMFEVRREGLLLAKDIRLPLQGVDVQIFAEALVSISHLIYRHEPAASSSNRADKAVRGLFAERKIKAQRNAPLEGAIEKRILIDYLVQNRKQLAIKVVQRQENLLPYMEQWAFRWDDLRSKNRGLITAMVYDPENQTWDTTAMRIGTEKCDVFCRYDETQELQAVLDKVAA